jgi:CRISPR-associated protein Cas1
MVAEHSGQEISEGRIRYHADNVMVRVPIDDAAFDDLKKQLPAHVSCRALLSDQR